MDEYLTQWLEQEASEGGFAPYLRALRPNPSHSGTRGVWGNWFGMRINYDLDQVTFTDLDEGEESVTMSVYEGVNILESAQDKLMGR